MKKTFMLLVLMLCAVVSMQAQGLIGNWKTTITDNDEKVLTFIRQ